VSVGVCIVECTGVGGLEEMGEECVVESEKVGEWDQYLENVVAH